MRAPIYEFVKKYEKSGVARFHMPGHKGKGPLGVESLDITEIHGADVLSSADGIIKESESCASYLFDTARTFYSTEGSTLAIKAMLAIALVDKKSDTPPVVLAARNVHKAFVCAAGLLDLTVEWLYPSEDEHLCSAHITSEDVERALSSMSAKPFAVYITSPDYLGNIADVHGISRVCDKYRVPLLVDNAHGAYLAFLSESLHPTAHGAAMSADSAHKTLPVLTGGAYLHISRRFRHFAEDARERMAIFASTSPSYLILQSLDLCNLYLASRFHSELAELVKKIAELKLALGKIGFQPEETEPLKLVFRPCRFGYSGTELAEHLRRHFVEVEFADDCYTVLMLSTQNTDADLERLYTAMTLLERREACPEPKIRAIPAESAISIRSAMLAPHDRIPISEAIGRICAEIAISCPPAVPPVICGERITEQIAQLLRACGLDEITVVSE